MRIDVINTGCNGSCGNESIEKQGGIIG
jgi:hypothetical protein